MSIAFTLSNPDGSMIDGWDGHRERFMNTTKFDQIICEGKPVPSLEPLIAENGRAAIRYAFNCLKGPFPAAEPTISKNADWSYEYAVYVLQGRFPAGEAAIARNEINQTMYAEFLAKRHNWG